MKQPRWKNDFSAWQLHHCLSRGLIASDPLHIPVTFQVKENRRGNIYKHGNPHHYNIQQTALDVTFMNKSDSETQSLFCFFLPHILSGIS